MSQHGLTVFIRDYIDGRRQTKLESFDKEVNRKLAAVSEAEYGELQQQLAEERQQLLQRYQVPAWLTAAAARAGQISLVTHAAKYSHSDSKSSSVLDMAPHHDDGYLTTATLSKPATDAVGNAAVLDVAKLLQTDYEGDSLLACLQRHDDAPLAELAETPAQLTEWVAGFSQALTADPPASHKRAKQIYFPVGDGYHLLAPLFSSSLAQALHQRLTAARFSEESKAVRQAQKALTWHPLPSVAYPATAILQMGGTKPQNISYLNSVRNGQVWLLPSAPPQWQRIEKPPVNCKSVFDPRGPFHHRAYGQISQLKHFLFSVQKQSNSRQIRVQRQNYIDEIIDILFNVVAEIRQMAGGWSVGEDCHLLRAHQLWLDPTRASDDALFRAERERGDWQPVVADHFAVWLNQQLRYEKNNQSVQLNMGEIERREWATSACFRQRLRELEAGLSEEAQ